MDVSQFVKTWTRFGHLKKPFLLLLRSTYLLVYVKTSIFSKKNILHANVFELTTKNVLTYHGHKFTRERHYGDKKCERKKVKSLLLIDCSAEFRVDSLREKL